MQLRSEDSALVWREKVKFSISQCAFPAAWRTCNDRYPNFQDELFPARQTTSRLIPASRPPGPCLVLEGALTQGFEKGSSSNRYPTKIPRLSMRSTSQTRKPARQIDKQDLRSHEQRRVTPAEPAVTSLSLPSDTATPHLQIETSKSDESSVIFLPDTFER